MSTLAPAHIAAISLAVFGVGLIAAAFVGAGFGTLRLLFGIGLVVAALITAGVQLLSRHAAPTKPDGA